MVCAAAYVITNWTASLAGATLAVRGRRPPRPALRLPVTGGAGGELGVVEAPVRPRSGAPWSWTMRYSVDSPMPSRAQISDVDVLESA